MLWPRNGPGKGLPVSAPCSRPGRPQAWRIRVSVGICKEKLREARFEEQPFPYLDFRRIGVRRGRGGRCRLLEPEPLQAGSVVDHCEE